MPTQKKFLDEAGLIQLLQEIEALDETNVKDLYWSTDNADTYPTIIFKVGDDNGSAHTTKKLTFKGTTGTAPSGATARNITITIGNVDKTITYYDTTNSSALEYSYTNDTNAASSATTVKAALDRVITKVNNLKSTNVTMNAAITGLGITTSDTVQSAFEKVNTTISNLDPDDEKVQQDKISGSSTDTYPIILANSQDPDGAKAHVKYSNLLQFNFYGPSLQIQGGAAISDDLDVDGIINIGDATLTETDYSGNAATADYADTAGYANVANDYNGDLELTINDGTTTDGPEVVLALGTMSPSGYNIPKAATSKYGVVRIAAYSSQSPSDTTNDGFVPTLGTVKTLINDLNKAQFVLHTGDLPTLTSSNFNDYTGKIYLVKDQEYADTNQNIFNEYVALTYTESGTTQYKWELIGTTDAGVDVVTIPTTGANSVASLFDTYVTNA